MYAGWLLALTLLFIARVVGQVLVRYLNVGWLPAEPHWYSGLMPYPILLPVQLVMIVVMLKLVADVYRGNGWFSSGSRRAARIIRWLAILYFLSMVLRYVVTMALNPEWRWFGHTIPIWFHMVLAGFLFTYSRYLQAQPAAE